MKNAFKMLLKSTKAKNLLSLDQKHKFKGKD